MDNMYIIKDGWVLRKGATGGFERFIKYEPTLTSVHVNTPLTNISIAYMQDPQNFVADSVFPNIPVDKQSDRYYVYDRGYFFRDQMKKRAPGTESAGAGYSVDNTPSYFADVWALHHDIPDQVAANADAVVKTDIDASNLLSQAALINREVQFASNWFKAGVWTNDLTGVTSSGGYGSSQFIQWSTANSTPIEDVRHFKTVVLQSTGYEPNTLTLDRRVYDILCDHAEFIDRIKYGQTGNGSKPAQNNIDIMKQLFEVDNLYVAKGVQTTSAEGVANTFSFITGKAAMLTYKPPAPGLLIPSAGYTFSWNGYTGAGPQGQRIAKFRMEWLKANRVEIEQAYAQKLVSADLGVFFGSAVA